MTIKFYELGSTSSSICSIHLYVTLLIILGIKSTQFMLNNFFFTRVRIEYPIDVLCYYTHYKDGSTIYSGVAIIINELFEFYGFL